MKKFLWYDSDHGEVEGIIEAESVKDAEKILIKLRKKEGCLEWSEEYDLLYDITDIKTYTAGKI